jgi:hypothetical protein
MPKPNGRHAYAGKFGESTNVSVLGQFGRQLDTSYRRNEESFTMPGAIVRCSEFTLRIPATNEVVTYPSMPRSETPRR